MHLTATLFDFNLANVYTKIANTTKEGVFVMLKKIITSILLCFLLVCPVALTACKDKGDPSKTISTIAVNGTIKNEFYIGEKLDIEGLKLKITYKDNSTTEITLTNEMIEGFDTSSTGHKSFAISYGGKQLSIPYTVREIRATAMQLATPFQTNYYTHSTLNVDGGTLVIVLENGATEEVTLTSDMISNFDTSSPGEKTLTITHRSFSLDIDYTVVDAEVSSLAVYTQFKTEYFVGDSFDVTGGKLLVTYADSNSEFVDVTAEMISNFNNTTSGTRFLTITYKGFSITYSYKIKPVELSTIKVNTPFKTEYFAGESLDVTGGKLLLTYNNGTTEIIDITASMVSNFNNAYVDGTQKSLTITYNHLTVTLNYTIKEVTVVSLTLTNNFKNTYNVGDSINVDGGLLTATYNTDLVEENIVVTGSMIAGFDTATAGDKTMTITYKNFTIEYNYTVVGVELVSIELTTNPTKTTYYLGDADSALDLSGGIITLHYSDGSTKTMSTTDSQIRASGFSTYSVGEKTITLSLKKTTFKVTYNYTVVEAPAGE